MVRLSPVFRVTLGRSATLTSELTFSEILLPSRLASLVLRLSNAKRRTLLVLLGYEPYAHCLQLSRLCTSARAAVINRRPAIVVTTLVVHGRVDAFLRRIHTDSYVKILAPLRFYILLYSALKIHVYTTHRTLITLHFLADHASQT